MAAPVVAGSAALVWQRWPRLTTREVSSALVNTASQFAAEDGQISRVTSVGSGLVDLARALDPIATVEPPTVGFGVFDATSIPVWQVILVTNRSSVTHAYRMVVEPRDPDTRASVTLDGYREIDFRLGPDEFVQVPVSLEGFLPAPGSYEGHLRLSRVGGGADLRVPYLYVVGDGAAHNAFALSRSDETGLAGERSARDLAGKFVDRHGAPVPFLPVRFAVREGDAGIQWESGTTDEFGVARAAVEFSGSPGTQVVVASGAGLEIPFRFEAIAVRPAIQAVANAASQEPDRPVAPGSLVTVRGSGFARFAGEAPASPLPVSLKHVSASFDFPELRLSVAAPVFYADPGEVGLQVPWEFAGLNFAYVKIRVRDPSGSEFVSDPVPLDLADVAPGTFLLPDPAEGFVPALQHPDGSLVSPGNPARPGAAVTVLMTGIGPRTAPTATGLSALEANPSVHFPSVTVGGAAASVTYSGSLPGVVGVDQVQFTVPRNARPGDLDLTVTVHGAASNAVTIPVR